MSMLWSHRSSSFEATEQMGQLLGNELLAGHVVALMGDLGAGKTCFARGVARGLGVDPCLRVTSPTFTLVNEFIGRIPLYHLDLYRLSEVADLLEIGFYEALGGQGACLVEWFDRFPEEIPAECLIVRLQILNDTVRSVEISALGIEHLELGRRWVARLTSLQQGH